jgi:hypothetical protein
MITSKPDFPGSIYDDILDETNAIQEILETQRELITETHALVGQCFEAFFLDHQAFEALCFLVVSSRNFDVTGEMLDASMALLNVPPKKIQATIKMLFEMHEQIMPYSLKAIIQALSSILPELSSH